MFGAEQIRRALFRILPAGRDRALVIPSLAVNLNAAYPEARVTMAQVYPVLASMAGEGLVEIDGALVWIAVSGKERAAA